MVLLEKIVVPSGGASSVTFTSIPQSYTDLVVKCSLRQSGYTGVTWDWLKFRFNSELPEDNPQIKGLHRGQLMLAMFAATGYTFFIKSSLSSCRFK